MKNNPLDTKLKKVLYIVALIVASIIINEIYHSKINAAKHIDLTPEIKI